MQFFPSSIPQIGMKRSSGRYRLPSHDITRGRRLPRVSLFSGALRPARSALDRPSVCYGVIADQYDDCADRSDEEALAAQHRHHAA